MCCPLVFEFSVGIGGFVIGLGQISFFFSVAERTLVWSYNHIQMQCYAVMKLILKEFINPHCRSSVSRVMLVFH